MMRFPLSSIFVSICTLALTWQTYLLASKSVDYEILVLVFFSTLFVYSFHRLIKAYTNSTTFELDPKVRFILIALVIISVGVVFPLLFDRNMTEKLFFFPAGLIAIFYSTNFIRKKGRSQTLRNLPFLKIFIISAMWSLMTVTFPLLDRFWSTEQMWILLERFVFILAITIPFDIRDIELDRMEGLQTFPVQFGWRKMKVVSQSLILVFVLIATASWFYEIHSKALITALVLSGLISFFVLSRVGEKNSMHFFEYFVEGLSLLQFLLVYAAYQLT